MAITFKDDAVVQTALGIGPQGSLFGIFAAPDNPWDIITECPQHSIYFKTGTGEVFRKSGTGYAIGDWEAGISPSVQQTIQVKDSGANIYNGPVVLDYLNSLAATNPSGADVEIKLVNDVESPGNSYYYGTDGAGTKGWFELPAADDDIEYDSSEGESARTFTSYQQKVSLAFTAVASDYWIMVSAEVAALASGGRVAVRAQVDNTDTFVETDDLPDGGAYEGWGTVSAMYKTTLAAGARTIDLDYASTESGKEARIRKARITAWKVT